MTPEHLAEKLAAAAVQFAALTDHDTTAGLGRFKAALARFSIGYISGVELTAWHSDCGELHLLAYGIDAEYPELQKAMRRRPAGTAYAAWPPRPEVQRAAAAASASNPQTLSEAIALVHRAGGLAFLPHPLTLARDPPRLERLLKEARSAGLDGIEAFYAPYSQDIQQSLARLAEPLGLLVVGGSDFHFPDQPDTSIAGIDLPTPHWDAFRRALLKAHRPAKDQPRVGAHWPHFLHPVPVTGWKKFMVRIVLPTIAAILLFFLLIFAVVIPFFEENLMDRKRETIRDLTDFVCRTLTGYEQEAASGQVTRETAQRRAAAWVAKLRYGPEGKDYFWISDLRAKMIAHPYRADLNGQDLSNFRDRRGHQIFVEFARMAREQGGGYVEYVWQWKDDPRRLAPKQSFVSLFAPWGWVVGTGLYTEDVRDEIRRLMRDMLLLSSAIVMALAGFLMIIVRESLRIERERRRVEEALRHSHETYRTLAEAATEGIILVLDGRCAVVNPMIRDLLGYTDEELMLMDLVDLLPDDPGRADPGRAWMQRLKGKESTPVQPCETCLKRKDGALVDVWLTATPLAFAGKEGFVIIAADISRSMPPPATVSRVPS